MTVAIKPDPLHAPPPDREAHWCEWQRIEQLCLCLLQGSESPPRALLEALEACQRQVIALRDGGWWQARLPFAAKASGLDDLALDALACVYAPWLLPRVGWLYQELHRDRQPAPSEALIAALLALPDPRLPELHDALRRLERLGLVERERQDPFAPLGPDRLSLARLTDRPDEAQAPPGARVVTTTAGWDDLVLPEDTLAMLREFLLWLTHRDQVVTRWGGQPTGGPVALFAGPSGTGKTLAASVLAGAMGWPLFRVDLAALVSKYIGETEKNLARLFDATHGRRVFLQFDEVDALMGKRGELREARDRYANMEVSYLLDRLETHDGPCLLTTNLRGQIDKAFRRRFQLAVEFPRPGPTERLQLWQRLLPPRAPHADDLDLADIAEAINLTGGQIRNAALHAAYLAAADQGQIGPRQVALAIHRELAKEQSRVDPGQLGRLAVHLDPGERSHAAAH